MIYSIENEKAKASVSTMGAELVSFILKKTGREYIWQGNPEFWTGHAYNLFPICGRLWDGKYTYEGKTYEMNLHGFARKTEYEFVSNTDNTLTFRLADTDVTYAQYPFHFELLLTYILNGTTLKTVFHIVNKDEKDLIFAVGGHPGFNLPMDDDGKFEDFSINFSEKCEPEKLIMSDTCYYTGNNEPFKVRCGKSFKLSHSLFDNDAIFLTNTAHSVTLKSSASKHFVTVDFPEMNYVGFWHKPHSEAPYVCIEPWTSIPADDGKIDCLTTKRSMMKLASGADKDIEYSITIG